MRNSEFVSDIISNIAEEEEAGDTIVTQLLWKV
jgi:hypothetical protein